MTHMTGMLRGDKKKGDEKRKEISRLSRVRSRADSLCPCRVGPTSRRVSRVMYRNMEAIDNIHYRRVPSLTAALLIPSSVPFGVEDRSERTLGTKVKATGIRVSGGRVPSSARRET